MNQRAKMIFLILVLALVLGCETESKQNNRTSDPMSIVSWSAQNQTVILKSTENIDASDYLLKRIGLKKTYSLEGVTLKANIATTVQLPSNWFAKEGNTFVLGKLVEVDRAEDL